MNGISVLNPYCFSVLCCGHLFRTKASKGQTRSLVMHLCCPWPLIRTRTAGKRSNNSKLFLRNAQHWLKNV